MPKQASIKITEHYYNKGKLNALLAINTNDASYPIDMFINTKRQNGIKGLLKGSKRHATGMYVKQVPYEKKKYGKIRYGRLMAKGGSI